MNQNDNTNPLAGFWVAVVIAAVMLVVAGIYGLRIYEARNYDPAKAAESGVKLEPPKPEKEQWPLFLWSALNAVGCGALASWFWTRQRQAAGPSAQTPTGKLIVLGVGGILGFSTAVFLGLGYVYVWWDTLTSGRAAWKEPVTWVPVLLVLAGLFVMFISLITVRSEERQNPALRRLIYGYNAALTSLLVLAILGVGNVMAFFYGTHHFDWTETNIYSISPASIRVLESLDRPVKVYVLIPRGMLMYSDMQDLLNTAMRYSSQVEVEHVTTPDEFAELQQKYGIQDNTVVAVVYDPDTSPPATHFLKAEDLEDIERFQRSRGEERSFKGEQALINAISLLKDGKGKVKVYFTQNNGEMQLSDFAARDERGEVLSNRGLANLRSRLEKANYEVGELHLGEVDPKTGQAKPIPDDAAILVLADPRELPEAHVKLLEEYLKRPKGRLVALLDAHVNRKTGQSEPSGLEGFLAGFGVQVGKDIILNLQPVNSDDFTEARVVLSRQSDRGFDAFRRSRPFAQWEVRSIRPAGPGGAHVVTPLLETLPQSQWAEEALRGSPREFLENLVKNQQEELAKRLQGMAIPVAVTVRDQSADRSMPQDRFHAGMRQDGPPRMVVFGDATFISNPFIEGRQEIDYTLFASALAWLRGRTDIVVDVEPKDRKNYRLNMSEEKISRSKWLPFSALLMGVVGLGLVVWFTRLKG